MSFAEMERGLEGALVKGLGGSGGTFNPVTGAPKSDSAPVLDETHNVLDQTRALTMRVMELADRLCGGIPTSGESDKYPDAVVSGEVARLRGSLRDTRQSLVFADEALTRIEKELIG